MPRHAVSGKAIEARQNQGYTSTSDLFDNLRLSFRKGMINDMQLIDSIGQRTNILFLSVKMNQPLDAAQFSFQPPADADVIEE